MDIKEFKQQLPAYKAVIGFDYGEKRLGVAVSDLLLTVATSYGIIQRRSHTEDFRSIKKIIAEKEVGGMVFGLPLQMDGTEGKTAAAVRKFAGRLAAETGLPCAFWDERLSSRAVENFLIKEIDMSRKKRKNVLDASAASYILQGFLDALKFAGGQ
jgi:RNAse H domain protein, YqgF family